MAEITLYADLPPERKRFDPLGYYRPDHPVCCNAPMQRAQGGAREPGKTFYICGACSTWYPRKPLVIAENDGDVPEQEEGEKGWHLGARTRPPASWVVAFGVEAGEQWRKAERNDASEFEREHPLRD